MRNADCGMKTKEKHRPLLRQAHKKPGVRSCNNTYSPARLFHTHDGRAYRAMMGTGEHKLSGISWRNNVRNAPVLRVTAYPPALLDHLTCIITSPDSVSFIDATIWDVK